MSESSDLARAGHGDQGEEAENSHQVIEGAKRKRSPSDDLEEEVQGSFTYKQPKYPDTADEGDAIKYRSSPSNPQNSELSALLETPFTEEQVQSSTVGPGYGNWQEQLEFAGSFQDDGPEDFGYAHHDNFDLGAPPALIQGSHATELPDELQPITGAFLEANYDPSIAQPDAQALTGALLHADFEPSIAQQDAQALAEALPKETHDSSIAQRDALAILRVHGREDRPLGTSLDCFIQDLVAEKEASQEEVDDCLYSIGDESDNPSLGPPPQFDPRNKMDTRLVDLQLERCMPEEDHGYYKPYDAKRFVIHTLFLGFEKSGLTSVLKSSNLSAILTANIPNGCPRSRVFNFDSKILEQEQEGFMNAVNRKDGFESEWFRVVKDNILTRHAVWVLAIMLRKKHGLVWEFYSHPDLALNLGGLCTTLELLIKKALEDAQDVDKKVAHRMWTEEKETWEKHRSAMGLPGYKQSTQSLDGTYMFRQETLSPINRKKETSADSLINMEKEISADATATVSVFPSTSCPKLFFESSSATCKVDTAGHPHKLEPLQRSLTVLPPISEILNMFPNRPNQGNNQSNQHSQQYGQQYPEEYESPPYQNAEQVRAPSTFPAPPESPWAHGNPYAAPNPYSSVGYMAPNPANHPRTDIGIGHGGQDRSNLAQHPYAQRRHFPPVPANHPLVDLDRRFVSVMQRMEEAQQQQQQQVRPRPAAPQGRGGTNVDQRFGMALQSAQQQPQQQQMISRPTGPRGRPALGPQYASAIGPGELRTDRQAVRPTPTLTGPSPPTPGTSEQSARRPFHVPSRSRQHRDSSQPYRGRSGSSASKPPAPTAPMAPSSSHQPLSRQISTFSIGTPDRSRPMSAASFGLPNPSRPMSASSVGPRNPSRSISGSSLVVPGPPHPMSASSSVAPNRSRPMSASSFGGPGPSRPSSSRAPSSSDLISTSSFRTPGPSANTAPPSSQRPQSAIRGLAMPYDHPLTSGPAPYTAAPTYAPDYSDFSFDDWLQDPGEASGQQGQGTGDSGSGYESDRSDRERQLKRTRTE